MKLSFLPALHHIIFFSLVLMLSLPKGAGGHANSSICKKNNISAMQKINHADIAKENAAEMLHGELLFKY